MIDGYKGEITKCFVEIFEKKGKSCAKKESADLTDRIGLWSRDVQEE